MIKCTNADKPQMLEYLKRNQSENCFLIGDVENFDLDEDFIDIWKPEGNGEIEALLMRYFNSYQISAISDDYSEEMAEIIKGDPEALSLGGLQTNVQKMETYIGFLSREKSSLAELRDETFTKSEILYNAQKAAPEDIDDLFEFQRSISEFSLDERNRKSFGNEIITNTGRTYFIKEKGRIISSATVTAENSCNGMIIGVATDEGFRRKGYARACVARLCEEMMSAGKRVLLFYNNPTAGKLYKDIGFRDINKWMMVKLK